MNTKSFFVIGSVSAGLAIVLALIAVPYQLSQQIQQQVFTGQQEVYAPFVPRPAYATTPMTNVFAFPSDNTFGAESFYHIGFTVSATGQRTGQIIVTFPSGFNVASKVIQESGMLNNNGVAPNYCPILNITGNTLTCTVYGDMQIYGTVQFMLDFSGIQNGYSANNQLTLTMKDDQGIITFGPTNTQTFTLAAISNKMIANNAVTANKIANGAVTSNKLAAGSVGPSALLNNSVVAAKMSTSFMKHVVLHDDATGNAAGWTPAATNAGRLTIQEPNVNGTNSLVLLNVNGPAAPYDDCWITALNQGSFGMYCNNAPGSGAILDYEVINSP